MEEVAPGKAAAVKGKHDEDEEGEEDGEDEVEEQGEGGPGADEESKSDKEPEGERSSSPQKKAVTFKQVNGGDPKLRQFGDPKDLGSKTDNRNPNYTGEPVLTFEEQQYGQYFYGRFMYQRRKVL